MPRLTNKLPSYRLHKRSGQAVVSLDRRTVYLGKHGSPESRAEYDRVVAEWLVSGRRGATLKDDATPSPDPHDLTVNEVALAYWKYAERHYKHDGRPARELDNIRDALRHLKP